MLPVPDHLGASEPVSFSIGQVRRCVEVIVRNWVSKDLEDDRWPASILSNNRYDGRQVATGAGATHRDVFGVDAERRTVLGHPASDRVCVLDGGRKLVLWRQTIADRQNDTANPIGKRAARVIGRGDAAGDPTAAVKIDERRE